MLRVGWSGGVQRVGAEDKEGREGSRGGGGGSTMPTHRGRGIASLATAATSSLELGLNATGDWDIVGRCHTMSNQYELPRAAGPQRHISSKVAASTKMVAALKFTSACRLETRPYGFILRSVCVTHLAAEYRQQRPEVWIS